MIYVCPYEPTEDKGRTLSEEPVGCRQQVID